ncbi:MAG: homocysteine S-methyltransferase family protein, partial [Planctomycetes bacterium]|nr:homocysteine S-methyltransferase family protein [Planctomycetota bacterium]
AGSGDGGGEGGGSGGGSDTGSGSESMGLDMKAFVERVRVSDGAWGTELQAHGLPAGACPELWNADNPAAVEAVARSYVEAGSDVILTNTFGANRFVLARHGAGERAAELTESGVAISRRIAGGAVKVFASMGPTGKVVMMEEVAADDISAAYAEQARAAAAGGADAVVLETFNELAELELAMAGVRAGCSLPVVCCMTFSAGPDKTATTFGTTPGELLRTAEAAGAAAVGANCGVGPDGYVRIAEMLRGGSDLPVWIKANAGMPQLGEGGKTVFPMGPEQFASYVPALIAAGANIIGGCCGTTPRHVRLIRREVDKRGG